MAFPGSQNLNVRVTAQDDATPVLTDLQARFAALHAQTDALQSGASGAASEVGGIGAAGQEAGAAGAAGMGLMAVAIVGVTLAAAGAKAAVQSVVSSIKTALQVLPTELTSGFTNGLAGIQNVFQNFSANLGFSLINAITPHLDGIMQNIAIVLHALEPFGGVIVWIVDMLVSALDFGLGKLVDFLNWIRHTGYDVAVFVGGIIDAVGATVVRTVNGLIGILNNWIQGTVAAINTLLGAVGLAGIAVGTIGNIPAWVPMAFGPPPEDLAAGNLLATNRSAVPGRGNARTIPSTGTARGGTARTSTGGTRATATARAAGPSIAATPQSNMQPINITVQVLPQPEGNVLQQILDELKNMPQAYRNAIVTYTGPA